MDKERIRRLINFDDDDVSTGFNSVSGDPVSDAVYEEYIQEHIESICGFCVYEEEQTIIPPIENGVICFYKCWTGKNFEFEALWDLLKTFRHYKIGLDNSVYFRAANRPDPDIVINVCKRTLWFDGDRPSSLNNSEIFLTAEHCRYSGNSSYWIKVYDGLCKLL